MKQWLGAYSAHPFETFGYSHLVMLVMFALGTVFLLHYSKYLKRGTRTHTIIKWLLFNLLFICELSYQAWALAHGFFFSALYLPLHLCGIASIIGMIGLLTYHPKLIQVNFFIGIVPAALALITPDLPYDYEHFRFWKFFIQHMAIVWTSLFLLLSIKVPISLKVTLEAYIYLVGYAVLMGFFNNWMGTNYLYLSYPPIEGTLLNYLGSGFAYLFNLGLTALSFFFLLLVFYKGIYLLKRK
ncbi:TIGR02206 family membrane protein [Halobacillus sp. Marseille-Q1614]|uniref:YwaF family protein n=1 Tax=Halobacillus sp. Marseille-Q1614 TaxID=2709134 RepID=UPI001570C821|nr:TIGR02206 family membrane protein [Halobacillus sp. Marseille-Q1614]